VRVVSEPAQAGDCPSRRVVWQTGLAAFGISAVIGSSAALLPTKTSNWQFAGAQAAWTEVAWPFAIDQWGGGRAFQCKAAGCGTDIALLMRAKIGFCNCTTGVADDEEFDRVSDVDLVDGQKRELGPGLPIVVRWMKGRGRAYSLQGYIFSPKSMLSIAFNDRCDVIVATAVVSGDSPMSQQPAVLEFLNSDMVMHWVELTLGL
jgi:hypothetical protein